MPISIEHLRRKRKELDSEIQRLVKEKEHIDYVLRHFANEEDEAGLQLAIGMPASTGDSFEYRSKHEKLKVVIDMLKNAGHPMKSAVIYRKLDEQGISLKKTTFDAYMSMWVDDPLTHIVRTAPGMYTYTVTV
jgi:hypothetical protein